MIPERIIKQKIINLDLETITKLDKISKKTNRTKSEIMRTLIVNEYAQQFKE